MATLVAFHAHPDDESISMGGTIAMAAARGHRVVLVVATRGERGDADGLGAERLAALRVAETHAAAGILGIARVEFLGYGDSGTAGEPGNADPACFWQADVADAACRLAGILAEEAADVLTLYDENGGYRHPDHVQVHRVGHLAARSFPRAAVYEATVNRNRLVALLADASDPQRPSAYEFERVGLPEPALTTEVDVRAWLERKRSAIAAHASQRRQHAWLLGLPDQHFAAVFGTEWFVRARPQFTAAVRERGLLGLG